MTRLRTVAFAVAVWCAVVAVGASLVWVVIAKAGQGVVPEAAPQVDVTASLPVPAGERSDGRRGGPARGPGGASPRRSDRTTSPEPSPSSRATTAPVAPSGAQRRSWSDAAGHVVAECQSTTARLVSTFPGTGWRYTILDRGPAVVRVRFQRLGEDHFVTVTAQCVSGVPTFATSTAEPGDE